MRSRFIPILTLALFTTVSFVIGFCLGREHLSARLRFATLESKSLQSALDNLESTVGLTDQKLEELSYDPALSSQVLSALEGKNQDLNPSNFVFVSLDQKRLESGRLRTPLDGTYDFQVVVGPRVVNNKLRKAALLVVCR